MISSTAKILIIDDFHTVFTQSLRDAEIECNYRPDFDLSKDAELLKHYSIIAVRSKIQFNSELIQNLPDLKCIARGGAGMDNIDEEAALKNGITLLNAPEGNRDAVAEHSIGLLLGMSKNIVKSNKEVSQFIWDREGNRGWELSGKTIGLFGFGNTATCMAKKLSGFDCKVLTYDKYHNNPSEYATHVSKETLLNASDVLSFHIPLTKESRHLIASECISEMKEGVVLINTSRGGICKIEDVWEGIKSGKIKSFAGDVLENENMSELSSREKEVLSSMYASNQVIITPHIAGWSFESYRKIAEVLAKKIIDYTMKPKNN